MSAPHLTSRSILSESWSVVGDDDEKHPDEEGGSRFRTQHLETSTTANSNDAEGGIHMRNIVHRLQKHDSANAKGLQAKPASAQDSKSLLSASRRQQGLIGNGNMSQEPELVMPDMSTQHLTAPLARSESTAQPRSAPRKSRRRGKASEASNAPATPSRKQARSRKTSVGLEGSEHELESWLLPELVWNYLAVPLANSLFSVLSIIILILQPLLHYSLAFAVIMGLVLLLWTHTVTPVSRALTAPLCHLPLVSHIPLLSCPNSSPGTSANTPIEFDALVSAQAAFEDVLSSTSQGASLPLDMKRSESSIRDLAHLVRHSTLPSRTELTFEFGAFVDDARTAASDLARFNARVARAVDHVLSVNRWTLRILDSLDASAAASPPARRWWSLARLRPDLALSAPASSHGALRAQYLAHSRALEDQIGPLVVAAQALLHGLAALDDRLDVVGAIAARDGLALASDRDDLLAALWTRLGGNRADVARLHAQLGLLREVGRYRKAAWAHVSAAMVRLQEMAAGLEDLRERVAAPEVLDGERPGGGGGVGGARGGRVQIPLRVHIESIQRGAERLEERRMEVGRVDAEMRRRVLEKAFGDGEDGAVGGFKSIEAKPR